MWMDSRRPHPRRGGSGARKAVQMRQIVPLTTLLILCAPALSAQVECETWGAAHFFSRGTAEEVRRCLEAGADVNARFDRGQTSLHVAARFLGYPGTRYFGEHIFVHEFAHAIHRAIRDIDPEMTQEIRDAYDAAMAANKYQYEDGRRHYATTNHNG